MKTPTTSSGVPILNLSVVAINKILPLKTEEEALLKKLEENRAAQAQILTEEGVQLQAPTRRAPATNIKGRIVEAVQKAGDHGIAVKDICEQTGLDRTTVDRWLFSGSAKGVKELTKVGPAFYKWMEVQAPETKGAAKKPARRLLAHA